MEEEVKDVEVTETPIEEGSAVDCEEVAVAEEASEVE